MSQGKNNLNVAYQKERNSTSDEFKHIKNKPASRLTSIIGGWPLSPTLRWFFFISHTTNLDLVPVGTGTFKVTSCSVCVHEYLSRSRPLPRFGTAQIFPKKKKIVKS
jgi:hypothetical protein